MNSPFQMFFFFYLKGFVFSVCLQMSRLALWVVSYWRITSRPTTRTFPQVFPILSSMNVSIMLETPHCSSVPPLVRILFILFCICFFFSLCLSDSLCWKWCTKNHWQLMQIFVFVLSDPRLLPRLLTSLLISTQSLKSGLSFFRHLDHYNCL